MVRNTLYISVPTYFRCPISMDVMKSPVSLCTGVTYDRSSIQHWLESGHDTCPATNQSLPTKDFVPNLTLHRLINLWCRPPDSADRSPAPSISRDQVRALVTDVSTRNENWRASLSKIAEFAATGGDSRKFLADLDGFAAAIVAGLSGCDQVEISETIVNVLDLILTENGVQEKLNKLILRGNHDCLSSILSVLRKGNLKSKAQSARILEAIAIDAESKRNIAEKKGLMSVLLHLLRSSFDSDLDDAVLSCLVAISATRSIRTQLAELGLVQVLSERLSDPKAKSSVAVTEKSLKLVSAMATVAEGRAAVSGDGGRCAEAAVESMLKVSRGATEDAVAAVWAMCCLYRDGRVQEAVKRSNGVMKILVVMQSCSSNGDGNLRRMCGDLVKVLGVGFKSSVLGSYDTKTTHIMPY